jgi:adenylosuccinate synthase
MQTVAVIGTQWGDEGKGKIVDLLATDADLVVRFQGGNNAAHTLVVDGEKFILRMVPAGALHPGKICVIGNGMVIDPFALIEELEQLKAHSHPLTPDRLKISCDAHLVMPYHRLIDRAREARLGARKVGTTGFGIGPAYEDKMARSGLRFADLAKPAAFRTRLEYNLKEKNLYLKNVLKAKPVDAKGLMAQIGPMRRRLASYIADTAWFVADAVAAGRRVLFEGAHGTMLDIDHGTYPFVTSSNCVASAVFSGGGLPPGKLDAVLGIAKAYATRVGGGPFPTEIKSALGDRLREEGDEFGSATGRPRRIGWYDAVLARYAARLNGMWGLALTKLDVLTGVNPLRICYAYQAGGRRYDEMPAGRAALEKVRPLYEELPGWDQDISGVRSLADLPENARRYLDRIAELGGTKLSMVGVGAGREAIIVLENPFLS